MWIGNISKEASECPFPWTKIFTIVLQLGNCCVISQFLDLCWCSIGAVKSMSYQQVVRLLMSHEHVDKLLQPWQQCFLFKFTIFLVHWLL